MWVKANWDESWERRKPFVSAAIDAGADAVIVKPDEVQKVLKLGSILVVAEAPAPGVSVTVLTVEKSNVDRIIREAKKLSDHGKKVAASVEVSSKELERAAVKIGKSVDYLIAVTPDWKVIPLENMVAELQGSDVGVLAGVKDAGEAKLAVETLEIGTAGVLLDPRERGADEIKKVCESFKQLAADQLKLVPAKVKTVRPVGSGDRACVDTTSLMTVGEGMLVGSQAGGLFLVHSETLPSEFVEPRPFRVNAGAVHAYVRLPGGKTKYISELGAGDEVLVVDAQGKARVCVIGRIKIERRPLLLVEAEREGEVYKTLLQNAETINLVKKDGKPISVAKLKPGDEVLLLTERAGRHFGVKVEESLVER
ncbi:MAG TPA: 3-dehydroquinate synthase II [Hadesarchaea archaeon]|nr:3-dehydroquinate synthase II [Hadesarchaea archaeon]